MDADKILSHFRFGKWADYVESFGNRCRLWPVETRRALVAVSGGCDSILLLWTLYALWQRRGKRLEVLHFNHQTRPSCKDEEALVAQTCTLLDLPLQVQRADSLKRSEGNFEHRARQCRYDFFKEALAPGDRLYLGHHLDDSLEWSLMAKWKSGRLRPQLGIPVINGPFARPFLCVSRGQIRSMAKTLGLEWAEDASNEDVRFERNFLRQKVLAPVKERFPGYLRHYVSASNELARRLGVWRMMPEGKDLSSFQEMALPLGGIGLFHKRLENDFVGAEDRIRQIVEKLGQSGRGRLNIQIDKIIAAALRGRRGPLSFSGGVEGHIAPGVLFFIRREDLERWKSYDRAVASALNSRANLETLRPSSMAREKLLEHLLRMPFPPMGVGDPNILGKWAESGMEGHLLLPETSALLKERGWWFGHLTKIVRKMDRNSAMCPVLPLDLLIQIGDFSCTMIAQKVR